MRRSEIGHEILAYLAEHPEAQDTMEGIIQWWLLEREIKFHTEKVREALSKLVEKGLVVERKGKDAATTRYQLNSKRKEEIKALLKGD